jgi:hypothetical protein
MRYTLVADLRAARIDRLLRRLATTPSTRFRLVCGPETPYMLTPCRVISMSVRKDR